MALVIASLLTVGFWVSTEVPEERLVAASWLLPARSWAPETLNVTLASVTLASAAV